MMATTARRRPILVMGEAPPRPPGRQPGEREIAGRQDPQSVPVARDLRQAGPHLVETDKAVDRQFGRDDARRREHRGGHRLARPGVADEKEQRKPEGEEGQQRRLLPPEKGADGLAEETRGQNERYCEQEYLGRASQRREAVEMRQHAEEESQRRQVDDEMR